MRKIFLNLTNGLEAIERYGLNITGLDFIRIQSSHCEAGDYEAILREIDHNFLMNLAIGNACVVYDFGAGTDIPKAVHLGLTWIEFVLNKRWFGKEIDVYSRGNKLNSMFREKYHKLPKKLFKKVDYYKTFINKDRIYLSAVCESTDKDNDKEYYRSIL